LGYRELWNFYDAITEISEELPSYKLTTGVNTGVERKIVKYYIDLID